jgi:hypothetical protein
VKTTITIEWHAEQESLTIAEKTAGWADGIREHGRAYGVLAVTTEAEAEPSEGWPEPAPLPADYWEGAQ